uniref:Uncharacterized protein n=1 Tax=Callorhinchus milii TaxID=7868 RepID=A0A4W3H801_CALMI
GYGPPNQWKQPIYYILSVLKFTYPTLFQGWQMLVGGLLLQVSWKLGWVDMKSNISWFPGAVLFVGMIYAGSRALSKLVRVFFWLRGGGKEELDY